MSLYFWRLVAIDHFEHHKKAVLCNNTYVAVVLVDLPRKLRTDLVLWHRVQLLSIEFLDQALFDLLLKRWVRNRLLGISDNAVHLGGLNRVHRDRTALRHNKPVRQCHNLAVVRVIAKHQVHHLVISKHDHALNDVVAMGIRELHHRARIDRVRVRVVDIAGSHFL